MLTDCFDVLLIVAILFYLDLGCGQAQHVLQNCLGIDVTGNVIILHWFTEELEEAEEGVGAGMTDMASESS